MNSFEQNDKKKNKFESKEAIVKSKDTIITLVKFKFLNTIVVSIVMIELIIILLFF